jgi:hypothetical protein
MAMRSRSERVNQGVMAFDDVADVDSIPTSGITAALELIWMNRSYYRHITVAPQISPSLVAQGRAALDQWPFAISRTDSFSQMNSNHRWCNKNWQVESDFQVQEMQ